VVDAFFDVLDAVAGFGRGYDDRVFQFQAREFDTQIRHGFLLSGSTMFPLPSMPVRA
jgi:hypothetical protein